MDNNSFLNEYIPLSGWCFAACNIEVDQDFAPRFKIFRQRMVREYQDLFTILKNYAVRAGPPLTTKLIEIIDWNAAGLDSSADTRRSKGELFHPDVYMDELLQGMRALQRVMPAILDRLGIEFDPNSSELRKDATIISPDCGPASIIEPIDGRDRP